MRSTHVFMLSAAVALSLVGSTPAHPGKKKGHRDLTVMTRNLYFGGDIESILLAEDFEGVVGAVTQVWLEVQATDFEERAVELADEIVEAKPDLIGLQEAALWRVQTPGDLLLGGTAPATEVAYDFVQLLLDELHERGVRYEVAVSQDAMDVELPNAFGQDIRLTDRDVVLVRRRGNKKAKGKGPVKIKSVSSGIFQTLLQVPVGGEGGPVVTIKRGWTAVDAKYHGRKFRFVNAHLEDDIAPPIQEAQAAELLTGPLAASSGVILVGDFNSDAFGGGTDSYDILLNGGFKDAWTFSGGATWGHDPDLLNELPNLTERLDLVLYDGPYKVKDADIVGEEIGDKTDSGLWPSDHAGLIVDIRLK